MLKKYEPLEDYLLEEASKAWRHMPLRHLASELMNCCGYEAETDFDDALERTFAVCCSLEINIPHHFRKVYVYTTQGISTDWQLTDLGSYLLLVNGNPASSHVARAQLWFGK